MNKNKNKIKNIKEPVPIDMFVHVPFFVIHNNNYR